MRLLLLAMAAALLAVMSGCGTRESIAERAILERAPELIGPADRYAAEVRGLSNNQADYVQLVGYGVQPEPGLRLDAVTLTLRNVRYQLDPFRITGIGDADFTTRVTDRAITDYLVAQGRATRGVLRNIQVQFLPNTAQVGAIVRVLETDIPVMLAGSLATRDGTQVAYVPGRVTVGGATVPATVPQELATLVTPLVRLGGLRFQPRITTLTLSQGALTLSGAATVPAQ